MPQAVELFFDAAADAVIRGFWADLDAVGVQSLASSPHHPHVSLAVTDLGFPTAALRPLAQAATAAIGLQLNFASLAFFLTPEAPAFLGVTATAALLSVHRGVAEAASASTAGLWHYYLPDAWMAHCTLAMPVTDRHPVIDAAAAWQLPLTAAVCTVKVIDIVTGATIATLAEA